MNRNLIFVAAALCLWGFGEGMFMNFVPIYLGKEFLLGEQQIGMALGAFGAFMAVTHLPGGYLADKIGRRPLLFVAWVMGLSATLIMGFATSLPFYLVGIFAYGLTAFVSSPLSSYVTAARGKWSVATALALISASFNIGMALGPVSGGWVGEHYGMRSSYLVASGAFLFSTLLIFFIKPQPIDKHDVESPPVSLQNNAGFISFLALVTFASFAMYIAQPLTPNFLKDARHLSLGDTGWVFSAGALGNALLTIALSRFKPRNGFIIAQALVTLFAFCIWLGTGLPILALGYFLMGGFRAARPLAQAQARELVHTSQMGLMYGALETANAFIFILVPPLAGFIFERDPFIIYPLAIGLIAISIVGSLIYSSPKVIHV
ncbi:MAG: MFS transporter [Anaerolineales bacterium]|nr:MFS transporter [Anaerolineales bacterium]